MEPSIPNPLRPALLPLLETIAALTQQIRAYDHRIVTLCQEQYPETRLLQPVASVGALTALAYILTLEDPRRFRKSREVGPALGLVPRTDQSGGHDPQLRITKTGDTYLRLFGSAQYILGPFGPDCLCPARVRLTTGSGESHRPSARWQRPPGSLEIHQDLRRTPTGTGLTSRAHKECGSRSMPYGYGSKVKGWGWRRSNG
ncbi:MAG: transposase [Anaerolineales bacterium]